MDIRYAENALTGECLAAFRDRAGWGSTPLPQAKKAIEHTLFSVVAFDGEEAVGIGRLVGDGALVCYIQDLIVLPGYQNNGIGSALINRLLDFAAKNGVPDSVMTVGLMSAKDKEPFYRKFGFRSRPNDREGAGMVANQKL